MNAYVFAIMRAFRGKLPKPDEKRSKKKRKIAASANDAEHSAREQAQQEPTPHDPDGTRDE